MSFSAHSFFLRLACAMFGTCVFLLACGPDNDKARLVGKIKGIDQATIMAYSTFSDPHTGNKFDSISVKNGEFSYERVCTSPTILTLVYPNFSTTRILLEPGKEVKLSGDANRLEEFELSGTNTSRELNDFRMSVLNKTAFDARQQAANFIRSHAQNLSALVVWADYFLDKSEGDHKLERQLLQSLISNPNLQPQFKQPLHQRLSQFAHVADNSLPPFSVQNSLGQQIDPTWAAEKPLLFVFTASWDGLNFEVGQLLRDLRHEYGNKLNIVYVSLDMSKQKALEIARRDSLSNVVCEEKGINSSLVKMFGIQHFPAAVLVGKGGKIIASPIKATNIRNTVYQHVRRQ